MSEKQLLQETLSVRCDRQGFFVAVLKPIYILYDGGGIHRRGVNE